MAVEVERLVATLEANFSRYDRALQKALGNSDRTFTRIEQRGKQMESRLSGLGGTALKGFLAGAAGAISLKGAQQLVDSATRIQNALKVAGLEGSELTTVYDRLFESAQRNAAPIEALVTLYSRMASAQKELHATGDELLQFTDLVAMSLRASGQSATEAQGALLQLSQALSGGTVQAEEYNSLLDGARPLLMAVAAGIKEAGGSVAELTRLVKDGQVSSEAFFRGGQAGAAVLEEQLAGAEATVSQAFVRLQNVLIDTAGELDDGTHSSEMMVEAITNLSEAIKETDWDPIISGIVEFGGQVVATIGEIERMARVLGDLTGASKFGDWVREQRGDMNVQSRIDRAFEGTVAEKGDRVGSAGEPMRVDVKRGQITLADYPAASSGKKKARGRSRGAGRAGKTDAFAREVAQMKERTAGIEAETKALASLNPLVQDYGYALEKAKAEQDLLSAAQKAGKAITPELRAEIEKLAEGYAVATVEAEKLAQKQDNARELAQQFNASAKDVLGGFISDIKSGVSATQALENALSRLSDKLLDSGLDALFDPKNGGGIGGVFSGWLGSLFGGGKSADPWSGLRVPTYAKGTNNHPGGLARIHDGGGGEIVDLPSGSRVYPHDLSRKMVAAQGGGGVSFNHETIVNNYSGATVSSREESDGRGGRRTVLQIDEAVANSIKSGPQSKKALKQGYGMRPGVVF